MPTRVSTFLWFEADAHAAAEMYCEIFPDAHITERTPMSAAFEVNGQRFVTFNGGPHYKLTPAVSVFVHLETQAEVDALWERFMAAGGSPHRCGWLVDKFGLSWQVIPARLLALLSDPDRARAGRAQQCMLTQQKIDLAAIERAAAGE